MNECIEIGNLNGMLEAIKLPASISDLNAGLANVDGNALSHFSEGYRGQRLLRRFSGPMIRFSVWLSFFYRCGCECDHGWTMETGKKYKFTAVNT